LPFPYEKHMRIKLKTIKAGILVGAKSIFARLYFVRPERHVSGGYGIRLYFPLNSQPLSTGRHTPCVPACIAPTAMCSMAMPRSSGP